MRPVYFDYNATTPLDPAVREAMLPYLGEVFGNPSSVHQVGRRARVLLDDARARVAQAWQCKPSEVVFTSGGTESNNLAILGSARLLRPKGRHLITSAIEHHAVLHAFDYLSRKEGFEVTILPVDNVGLVQVSDVAAALRPETILVSIMAANNEIGTVQPIAEIGTLCCQAGVLFHTDAVQWFGKEPFSSIHQFNADMVSVCSHKFHGPKGAGALFIRSPLHPDPILFGGAHENERRAGTENLPAIIGFAESFARFVSPPVFSSDLKSFSDQLIAFAGEHHALGMRFIGHPTKRLVNTCAFAVRGTDSMTLLAALDLGGFCASSGSACSSGALEPSHVVKATGASHDEAQSLIRFSFGRENLPEEIDSLIRILPSLIQRAQTSE